MFCEFDRISATASQRIESSRRNRHRNTCELRQTILLRKWPLIDAECIALRTKDQRKANIDCKVSFAVNLRLKGCRRRKEVLEKELLPGTIQRTKKQEREARLK